MDFHPEDLGYPKDLGNPFCSFISPFCSLQQVTLMFIAIDLSRRDVQRLPILGVLTQC